MTGASGAGIEQIAIERLRRFSALVILQSYDF
jgi:hypothetical protein